MAVQAHYHREPLFLARGGGAPERVPTAVPAMQMAQAQEAVAPHQHPPPLFLDFSHGDCGIGRKRQREAEATAVAVSPQVQGPKFEQLLLHKRPATGLRVDFDEGSEHVSSTSAASALCLLSDELAAQRDQHRNEMDRLIQEHAARLRRALGDARRRQYGWLLGAAGATGARRIREKEAEASEAALRGVEMEERIARLRGEAKALQAKALADQATAAAQAQRARRCKAEEDEGAAGSCFVDPDQLVVEVAAPARPCRTCGRRSSSVVLLPCRHLCVCAACEPAVSPGGAAACPMCRGAVTGTLQVFFS